MSSDGSGHSRKLTDLNKYCFTEVPAELFYEHNGHLYIRKQRTRVPARCHVARLCIVARSLTTESGWRTAQLIAQVQESLHKERLGALFVYYLQGPAVDAMALEQFFALNEHDREVLLYTIDKYNRLIPLLLPYTSIEEIPVLLRSALGF